MAKLYWGYFSIHLEWIKVKRI